MRFDQPPVVRISVAAEHRPPADVWPMTVGENGSGKSTIVEAVAMAYGLSPEGGTRNAHLSTRSTESGLSASLTLQRGIGSGGRCTAGTPTTSSSRPQGTRGSTR